MPTRPLQITRKVDGFTIQVFKRHRMLALLRKTISSIPNFVNWEVVVIRVNPVHPMDTASILDGWTHVESLPSSESWGTYGWTFTDLNTATSRFEAACADYDKKLKDGEIDDFEIDLAPKRTMEVPEI